MQNLFENFELPKQESKVNYEFQELGLLLQPIYGKAVWALFYKPGFTEYKIREAHKIAQARGVTKLSYLIGIIKRMPY